MAALRLRPPTNSILHPEAVSSAHIALIDEGRHWADSNLLAKHRFL